MNFMAANLVPLMIGAFAIALMLLVWILFIRKPKPRNPRYQPAVAITPRQFQALQYLQAAFPDSAVLLQRPLRSLVSPRAASDSEATQQALKGLDGLAVDFAICNDTGKPSYAFDLDAPGTKAEAEHARHKAAHKNGILKSAGVRLILLKGDASQWPTPSEFRLKLALAALQPLSPAGEPEVYKAQTVSPSWTKASQFQESSIMGMSVLMTLEGDDADAAWKAARN
jgi:hypothetical protein